LWCDKDNKNHTCSICKSSTYAAEIKVTTRKLNDSHNIYRNREGGMKKEREEIL